LLLGRHGVPRLHRPVDEDRDVPPHPALVVEHIRREEGVVGRDRVEDVGKVAPS
jgi:hypothetical protein